LLTPAPERETVAALPEALLAMEAVAVKGPAALGVKTILIVEFWPAATTAGRLGELNMKYLLEIETLAMLRGAALVFDADKVNVLLVPAVTLPKSRLAPLNTKPPTCAGWVVAGFAALKP